MAHDPARAPATPRRLPVGAEPLAAGGVHFRVWAPEREEIRVVLEAGPGAPGERALTRGADGYHEGTVDGVTAGTRYRYRVDGRGPFPDPASRFQPDGPHGPSEVVDPSAFAWTDHAWQGLTLDGQVFYELHVGTFTPEGTWAAAAEQLAHLADVGVTVLEVMPVADFPGAFGWGYDGVDLFAPSRLYGTPDDFRAFVDRAHALGVGVVLDVVYNHFGPDGFYLREFADAYVSTKHKSEWGDSPNFDGEDAGPVRELIVANAGYWIDEFHLDGLRLDATQSILDDSERHVLVDIGERVRARARGRGTIIVNENEPQEARLVRPPAQGGRGLDMIWNDDWHHAALVALTCRDDAYFTDYAGSAQEFVSAARYGFLYQGQWYRWQAARRGTPALDIEARRFVHFLENHDQVANSGRGNRPHVCASPAKWRALTTLLLLGPQTPMLFMGQEWGTHSPFHYFADHNPELARAIAKGREEFTAQFANLALPEMRAIIPAPDAVETFERCKLDHAERERGSHAALLRLHRDLLALRRADPCFSRSQRDRVEGAVLSPECFVLRWLAPDGADRLLVVNLGRTLHLDPAPEPLLAPSVRGAWRVLWASEHPDYGGDGALNPDAAEADRSIPSRPHLDRPQENWRIQGESAVVLAPAND